MKIWVNPLFKEYKMLSSCCGVEVFYGFDRKSKNVCYRCSKCKKVCIIRDMVPRIKKLAEWEKSQTEKRVSELVKELYQIICWDGGIRNSKSYTDKPIDDREG